jgi:tRNA pseudouridine55 synthase
MVSAIKRDGQPLYKLARRGITVERPPRQLKIYQLTLIDWLPPHLTIELTCSPGTYVRALARDLGQDLGCGAHLTALVRLASGDFTLSEAIELEQFSAAFTLDDEKQPKGTSGQYIGPAPEGAGSETHAPKWHALVMPIDAGLRQYPACTLNVQESRRVRSGQPLAAESIPASRDNLVRAYGESAESKLLALLRFDTDAQLWRPHKVFYPL